MSPRPKTLISEAPSGRREMQILSAVWCEQFHSAVVPSAVVCPTFWRAAFLQGALIMEIISHASIRSHSAVRNFDGWIMLGYVAFAVVALVAIYFASAGPGVIEANLAMALP